MGAACKSKAKESRKFGIPAAPTVASCCIPGGGKDGLIFPRSF